MSTLNDNDVFLVQQSGVTKTVKNIDRSTLDPEDRFLVQRNGVTHTIKSEDVGGKDTGSIDPPVAVLTPKNGAGLNAGGTYNPLSTAITNVGQTGDDTFTTDTIASVDDAYGNNVNNIYETPLTNTPGEVFPDPVENGYGNAPNGYTYGSIYDMFNGSDSNGVYSYKLVTYGPSSQTANEKVYIFLAEPYHITGEIVVYTTAQNTGGRADVRPLYGTPNNYTVGGQLNIPGADVINNQSNPQTVTNCIGFKISNSNQGYGDYWVRVNRITVNGSNLIIPNSTSVVGKTLTFPEGATHFDKFEQGDVVQTATWGASKIGAGATSLSGANNWNNGVLTNWASASYNGSSQAAVRITFDPPIYNITSLRTATGVSSSNNKNCQVSINWDGQGTPNKVSIGTFQWQNRPLEWRAWDPSYYASGISSIDFWNLTEGDASYTQNVGGIEINGEVVRGSGETYSISTINADATPPAIEVNGGSWYGADGSGTIGGATNISKTVTADASLTFTNDTELANMIGPLSQVDENGDVKTPVTSTIANVSSSGVLSSITCQQGITSGSSAISAIYLDGVILTSPSGSVFEGTFSSDGVNSDFSNLFDGNPNTAAFSKNSGRATYIFSPPIPFNSSLEIRGWNSDSGDKVLVNNQEVEGFNAQSSGGLSTVVVYGTTLTFESPNPDLKYFQDGDVIQSDSTGFKPVIYRGNGVTQSITGVGFSPDLVWCKCRTWGNAHALTDTVRGPSNRLSSNLINAQTNDANALTSFDSDGFTVGAGAEVNEPGEDYVAWCWKAGDTTVTNNDGSIQSQVRSNGSFSIVKYTGNGLMLRTVGHGLSAVPQFIIIKAIDSPVSWAVMPNANGNLYLELNGNNATNSSDSTAAWNNTAPTSSVFTINTKATVNENNRNYIAYCWAETPGMSKFGTYNGTGSTSNQPVIDCGFEPAFVMVKRTNNPQNWVIVDNARTPSDPRNLGLYADLVNIENTSNRLDFTSTGFRNTNTNPELNASSSTYIFAAFAAGASSTVVSTDLAANTMTVDGGKWGYSDPGPIVLEEVVSGEVGIQTNPSITGAAEVYTTDVNLINEVLSQTNDIESEFAAGWSTQGDPREPGKGIWGGSYQNRLFCYQAGTGGQTVDCVLKWKVREAGTFYLYPGRASQYYAAQIDLNVEQNGTDLAVTQENSSGAQRLKVVASAPGGTITMSPTTTVYYIYFVKVGGWSSGETTVTGQPLVAAATDVDYLNGNTLGISGVTGTWVEGLNAKGAEITATAPSPASVVYTSANGDPLTTQFTGTDATLTTRTWTWQVSNAPGGPWTNFETKIDLPGQDGATPLADKPTLEPNKYYRVKVRYDSNNAEYIESQFNTFKTGDA